MAKAESKEPEIVIPVGYRIEELLDTDDSDFSGEEPIIMEEVKLKFERDDR